MSETETTPVADNPPVTEPAEPTAVTPPVTPPSVPDDAPKWAQELNATVGELVKILSPVVGGGQETAPLQPDETPVAVPWTHRKIGRR